MKHGKNSPQVGQLEEILYFFMLENSCMWPAGSFVEFLPCDVLRRAAACIWLNCLHLP